METRLASEPDGLRDRPLDAREQFNRVLLRPDGQGPARSRGSKREVANTAGGPSLNVTSRCDRLGIGPLPLLSGPGATMHDFRG
jgi:hypothetical protein